ncbi:MULTISPECIES: LpqB family beta-propeller domain-containing protein [Brevibacterium]|uniref:LpqB family beta-propeller domain-containing protein n=1 Tax=Brevibacterium TaxID=1696 RepID=UPI0025BF71C1|nr:LpqB family beta-propeller domain-containing protein [Brevibacterium sp.]
MRTEPPVRGRSRGRLRALASGVAVACLLLSGCASIPVDGETGTIEVEEPVDGLGSEFEPDGPAEGAEAHDIVRGFLAAGAGYADDFAVARSFLTEDFAKEWDPQAGVTVMPADTSFDSLIPNVTSDSRDVRLRLPVDAMLNSQHVYREQRPDTEAEWEFSLRQVNGEWRISDAPQGLVLTHASFAAVFDSYPLYFYTDGYDHLVPDTRWFIRSTSTATEVVSALLAGPADHLRGAVTSAVPDGTHLDPRSVTVEGGIAQVALDASVQGLDGEDEGRLVNQIAATLRGLSSTNSVSVTSPAGELSAQGTEMPPVGVQTDQRPVVVSGGVLARLTDARVEPVAGLPEPAPGVNEPAVSFDEKTYAYLARGDTELHRIVPESGDEGVVLSDAQGLVAPSFDRFGNIWTSTRSNDGGVSVLRPSGDLVEVPAQWLAGRDVVTLAVSRDGTQLAVVSAEDDGGRRIDVIGILRNDDGVPTGLTGETPLRVGAGFTDVVDFSWAGAAQLAVLGSLDGEPAQPYSVGVSGPSRELGEVEGGVSITASSDSPSIRITTEAGELYSYGSDSWQKLVDIVAFDPAYPG